MKLRGSLWQQWLEWSSGNNKNGKISRKGGVKKLFFFGLDSMSEVFGTRISRMMIALLRQFSVP